jgi:uncharacterized YigZ family protein
MTVFSYRTIPGPSEAIYKEKGSKFLAFAYPVSDEKEVKICIEGLKKTYFDARHYCFAWMLGAEKTHFRAYDDGEPNHSAGDPILGQIRSKEITNVLVVVVRYFGGTKLGVGGLISAYKTAAAEALSNAGVIEKDVMHDATLVYDYAVTPEIMKLVKEFDLGILSQEFNDACVMRIKVKAIVKEKFDEKVSLLNKLGIIRSPG